MSRAGPASLKAGSAALKTGPGRVDPSGNDPLHPDCADSLRTPPPPSPAWNGEGDVAGRHTLRSALRARIPKRQRSGGAGRSTGARVGADPRARPASARDRRPGTRSRREGRRGLGRRCVPVLSHGVPRDAGLPERRARLEHRHPDHQRALRAEMGRGHQHVHAARGDGNAPGPLLLAGRRTARLDNRRGEPGLRLSAARTPGRIFSLEQPVRRRRLLRLLRGDAGITRPPSTSGARATCSASASATHIASSTW